MRKLWKKRIGAAALLAGIFSQCGGLTASAGQYVFADRHHVTDPELDAMRGGFVTDSGLQFTLGITKAVIIDGVLQTISSLNIPNLANLNGTLKNLPFAAQTGSTASTPATGSATVTVPSVPVSVGATGSARNGGQQADAITITQNSGSQMVVQQGNQVTVPQLSGSTSVQYTGGGTLIQNSANQKVIQNMTIVNMTTNSATIFRQLNITANIRQQFINMMH
ncbi:MAG TPA: hypothetical protein VFG19_15955 [Geobacteraceae bacterium]|nr:hypothetical protein [Geobacteraceae bacterium]